MISSVLLGVLLLSALIAGAIYFLGIKSARLVEKWAAGLSNGGHFPEKPDIKGLYWLLPVHRELQRVADKISGMKKQLQEAQSGRSYDEFLHHCILASLMEGILVVDSRGVITLANAEFINIFQLTQSPLQRTILEVIRDKKLQDLITGALTTGRVQSARISVQVRTEVGRPPALEVSAVPIRTQKEKVNGVIVLFLPPPDRTRILQSMKRHSQRLDNLVSELLLTGGGKKGGAMQLKREPFDLGELIEEVISVFTSKPESDGIRTKWQAEGALAPLVADQSYLQLALVHTLVNLATELERVTEIQITAEQTPEETTVNLAFIGDVRLDADLKRLFDSTFSASTEERPPIIGSSSGLSLVREILELHGGDVSTESREGRIIVALHFLSPDKPQDQNIHDERKLSNS